MSVLDRYSCEGQMSLFDLDSWFGKTCAEPLVLTTEKISDVSLKKPQRLLTKPLLFLDLRKENGLIQGASWDLTENGALLGVHTMLNTSEYPNVERESHLSQILTGGAPKVLFVGESVSRHPEQSNETGQGIAGDTKEGVGASSYTHKVRGGVEIDSRGKKAGKGALVQTELSGTLGVSQDQTLITGINGDVCGCLDSSYYKGCGERNGAEREVVAYGVTPTLATTHRGESVVNAPLCFEPGSSVRVGGHIYENSTGTIRANPGDNQQAVLCIENHPTDSRIKVSETDVVQTLTSRMGTGGMNVPLVAESEQKTFKKKGHAKFKGDGQGWEETDINDTLNTLDNCENRTPTLIAESDRGGQFKSIESHPKDSRYNLNPTDINQTIPSIMCHDSAHGGLIMENHK